MSSPATKASGAIRFHLGGDVYETGTVTFHRNGIGGAPFYSVAFRLVKAGLGAAETGTTQGAGFIAIRFDHGTPNADAGRIAVLRVGDFIGDDGNEASCWRGDNFVDMIDAAIDGFND